MSDKTKLDEKDPEVAIQSAIGRTENFIMENGRQLLTALTVVVLVVGGFFGYKYLVANPRADKAADMMFVAQQQFAQDSFALALGGDGANLGFLEVAEKYSSTPSGNLARHYAGICYLRLGDLDKALESLKKYKTSGEIPGAMVNAQNLGLQGDILSEQGNYKEAVALYEKAAAADANALTSPYYLRKAGQVYEQLGENAKALAAYKSIKTDYATSMEARDIDKYIGRLEQL